MRRASVYLYRRVGAVYRRPPEWGTLDAIRSIEGREPIARSTVRVDASLLDEAGFLPYGLTPYELEGDSTVR